ncbi:MAG: hypothetical protein ACI4FO_02180 [Acutalibacteraceae bacterium]
MKTQKTKKSFKKKALLSSLSMLMVATVAVGSATFAWFTSNKSVTADSMKVTAAAAQGLQITKDYAGTWASAVSYDDLATSAQTIAPVSLSYSNTQGTALGTLGTPYSPTTAEVDGPLYLTGKNANDDHPDNSGKFKTWTNVELPQFPTTGFTGDAVKKSNNFIAYKVGIKSTGDKIEETIKGSIKYTSTNNQEYVRIAVLENAPTTFTKEADGTVKNYAVGATTWDTDKVMQVYGNEPTDANAIVSAVPAIATQLAPVASETQFTVGPLDANTVKWYTVLIWFEGQDAQCVDINQSLAYSNIAINFSYT